MESVSGAEQQIRARQSCASGSGNKLPAPTRTRLEQKNLTKRRQFASCLLFLSVVIFVNLCPFNSELEQFGLNKSEQTEVRIMQTNQQRQSDDGSLAGQLKSCLQFVKLMFTNPVRLGKRTARFTQAEARVLGKMAKVWYIKKKIKKLSKKLKKHTIAVPVFTAIPIYEHSYYPQPHVTHVSHGGLHHAAAASSYSPTIAQVNGANNGASNGQQLTTSASNNHHQMAAYRIPANHQPAHNSYNHHHHHHPMYNPMAASSHQIINAYAPSPPLYVDEAGGLYGHYGNAYGRYDGGYHYL